MDAMEYLVLSDSHGHLYGTNQVLSAYGAQADALLYLGDGAADVLILRRTYLSIPIHAVLGNCDSMEYPDFDIKRELFLTVGGKKLYLCHGDRFDVGTSPARLCAYAKQKGADAALYGHLHRVCDCYFPPEEAIPGDKPFYLFSPGSISLPRDGRPSFGRLHVGEDGICFSVGRI